MKKLFFLILLSLLIGGCGLNQTPTWIIAGNHYMERFKKNFLTGEQPYITELNFQKAVKEIKKSGDLDLLEKAWLTRMALQGAVLKEMEEGDYGKIAAVKPVPANRNFYIFLTGDAAEADGALLPEQYSRFLEAIRKGDVVKTEKAIADMGDDPISQLIAAGLAVRRHLESEMILNTAVETASRNGWKMALLAWLERLCAFHAAAGDAGKAAAVRRRIELIEK